MKRTLVVTAVVALGFGLTGCVNTDSKAEPAAASDPTPDTEQGPVELTIEEAGVRYLQIVCPANIAAGVWEETYAAVAAQEMDMPALREATVNNADVDVVVLSLLNDERYVWPAEAAAFIEEIRVSYEEELDALIAAVPAESLAEVDAVAWPDYSSLPVVELRNVLGLDADTSASCIGYENGHEVLSAEE